MTRDDKFRDIAESLASIENNKKVAGALLDEDIQTYAQKMNDYKQAKKELDEKCVKDRRKYKNIFRVHKQLVVHEFLKKKKIIKQSNELGQVIIKGKSYTMRDLFEEFIEYLYLKEK